LPQAFPSRALGAAAKILVLSHFDWIVQLNEQISG